MDRICVRVRIFGPGLWALICLSLLNRGAGLKTMVPTKTVIKIRVHVFKKEPFLFNIEM